MAAEECIMKAYVLQHIYGTLAAISGFDQPSMIALASSRILELSVQLWKDCRLPCSYLLT
jgi:hypothetical protein